MSGGFLVVACRNASSALSRGGSGAAGFLPFPLPVELLLALPGVLPGALPTPDTPGSLREPWIETSRTSTVSLRTSVAPRAGAWFETSYPGRPPAPLRGRSPRGSADRNLHNGSVSAARVIVASCLSLNATAVIIVMNRWRPFCTTDGWGRLAGQKHHNPCTCSFSRRAVQSAFFDCDEARTARRADRWAETPLTCGALSDLPSILGGSDPPRPRVLFLRPGGMPHRAG
jgi:hypothetical protein